MYKEFIVKKQFDGSSGSLLEEIIEAFVNKGIVKSELGDFYNIAGVVDIEDFGDITFNIGVDDVELDMDGILEEEIIKDAVTTHFLYNVSYKYGELDIDSRSEAVGKFLDSNIKATYTLAYS